MKIKGEDPLFTPKHVLASWLAKHDAMVVGEHRTPGFRETTFRVRSGGLCIVRCFIVDGTWGGWDIYTSAPTNEVIASLTDAEARLGLK